MLCGNDTLHSQLWPKLPFCPVPNEMQLPESCIPFDEECVFQVGVFSESVMTLMIEWVQVFTGLDHCKSSYRRRFWKTLPACKVAK